MSVESEIVEISITQDSAGLQRAGFGTALFISHNATFPERVRYYSSIDDLALDWASTSPERRAANAIFGQTLKPDLFAIGRAANKPTQQYTVTAQAFRNSDSSSYKINVVGEGFTDAVAAYTSDSVTTGAEIHNGLVTALNAVTGKNYLATFAPLTVAGLTFTATNADEIFHHTAHGLKTGDGPLQVSNSGGGLPTGLATVTNYWVIRIDADTFFLATSLANALAGTNLTISTDGTGTQTITGTGSTVRPSDPFLVTGAAAGNWFSLELVDVTALSIKQSHTDPGLSADLDAIELEESNWYCILTGYNSSAYVQAVATWVEAQDQAKIYGFDVNETDSIQTTASIGTDSLATLHTAAFTRTFGSYHHRPATFMTAAWAGEVLPDDPGGDTWALKQLTGISMPSKLTATNRVNLRARNANWITTGFGKNITFQGTTFDGDFIDVTRGLDWLDDDMTKGIGGAMLAVRKVPFSDAGVAVIVNEVKASLDRAVRRGILRSDPKPAVTAPKVADIALSDRALRLLPDVVFTGQIEGAIHKVKVKGKVSI